jgi:hypothetical protein
MAEMIGAVKEGDRHILHSAIITPPDESVILATRARRGIISAAQLKCCRHKVCVRCTFMAEDVVAVIFRFGECPLL